MDLMHMIGETSLMMGFTFIVGMAFAYVLKLMTFFFSRLNGTEISALLRKGRIWARAVCFLQGVAHIVQQLVQLFPELGHRTALHA